MRNLLLILLVIATNCFATPNDTVIPPVIVSAKKFANHSITHAAKTVITQQDMSDIGATSLSQALQELGGVQLQDTVGNGSQVALSMRGFGVNASSNTLLLINGIPIVNPDLASPDLNAIPIQEIEYIEVTSGSEGVLYGDQAVGGTVNIITREKSLEKIAVSCSAGSYNAKNCYAAINNKIKQVNYGLNISSSHSDNYRDRNDYGQNHLSGRLDYAYQTGKLAFDYSLANEHMQYPGALTAEQVRQNRRQSENDTDFFRDWNGFYHLQNQQQLTTNWLLQTDASRREMHGDGILTSPFSQSRVIHFIKPQVKGTVGKLLLNSGIDFENDQYRLQSLYGVTSDAEQKYGIFGIANYPATSRLSFSVGARGAQADNQLDQFEITNVINRAIATTLGTSFQLDPNTQFYLRRAENFRFPKADENAATPPDVHGLKTQRGVSYETGVNWDYKNLLTKFDIYQINLRDEITFDPFQTPQTPFGSNRNLDPTVRRGATLTEKFPITTKVTVDGEYTLAYAKFQSGPYSGNRIPLVSENILHTGVNYAFTQRWNLYTEALYTGNQYAANDNANIAGKIGGYTTYNVNLRYHMQQFSAAFRINNIFNKYYYFYSVFEPSMPLEFFYPAPGRNFLLTLKYVFA